MAFHSEVSGMFYSSVYLNLSDLLITAKSRAIDCPLVTQPMLQLRPNHTELRSMDLSDQILCRFQKYKRKVPPPSLLFGRKKTRRLKVHFYGANSIFF